MPIEPASWRLVDCTPAALPATRGGTSSSTIEVAAAITTPTAKPVRPMPGTRCHACTDSAPPRVAASTSTAARPTSAPPIISEPRPKRRTRGAAASEPNMLRNGIGAVSSAASRAVRSNPDWIVRIR